MAAAPRDPRAGAAPGAGRLGQSARRCRSQVGYLADGTFYAEFFLTQIVSHHTIAPVARFLEAGARGGLTLPGVFGVFYYRSANPKTLQTLRQFLPVPVDGSRAIRRRLDAGRRLRAHDPGAEDAGRAALLRQQPPLSKADATLEAILAAI